MIPCEKLNILLLPKFQILNTYALTFPISQNYWAVSLNVVWAQWLGGEAKKPQVTPNFFTELYLNPRVSVFLLAVSDFTEC